MLVAYAAPADYNARVRQNVRGRYTGINKGLLVKYCYRLGKRPSESE